MTPASQTRPQHPPSAQAPGAPAPGRSPRGRRLRLAAWIALAGGSVAGLALWFFGLRNERLLVEMTWLHNGWLGLSAACIGLWALLASTPADAIRLPPRLGKRVVLGLSVILALVPLVFIVPVLSAEVLRYRFDGGTWLLGINPYGTTPAEAAAAAEALGDPDLAPDELDAAAPHPDRTSLNLPVSQAGFVTWRTLEYLLPGGAAEMRTEGWQQAMLELPWWRQAFIWRCLLAGAFLLTVAELIMWLRQRGHSPWWAVLFAWQPLVLFQTMGMGHQDMLGVLFLVAALRRADVGRYRRAGICLAASIAVKPLAIVIVPFVLRQAWRNQPPAAMVEPDAGGPGITGPASARRSALWFSATLLLLLMPLLLDGNWRRLASATADFAATAPAQEASAARLMETLFLTGEERPARAARVRLAAWIICGIGVAAAGVIMWLRQSRPAAAFYAMSLIGLLLSPTMPPWLLIWPLAMVPILAGRGGLTALVWAGTAGLSYLPPLIEAQPLAAPAVLWQFVAVYVVAALEVIALRQRGHARIRPAAAVD